MRRLEINSGSGLHFTVGSLRHTGGRSRGVDFRGELGLPSAALLYADQVRLVSVGASTVATLDELSKMPTLAKLELIREMLPQIQPDASPVDLQKNYRMIDSMIRALRQGKRGQGLSEQERLALRRLDRDLLNPLRNLVSRTLDEWGAVAFKVALRSELVEVRPFAATTPQKLLQLGMASGRGATDLLADNAYEEYRETILEAVGGGEPSLS